MKYSKELQQKIAEKCHEDLISLGEMAETMSNHGHRLTVGFSSDYANPENAALNAIFRKDPYAADREKTQMKRDDQGELAVQSI